jgi:cytochrome c-type biogenesis protein CcmH/NrfG
LQPNSIRNWFVASRVAGRGEAITSLDVAIAYIESGLDVSPRDPALRAELARLLVDRAARSGLPDDLDRAVVALDGFLDDAPNDTRLWLARGRAALIGDDRATARRALARAAGLDPSDQAIGELVAEAEKP